MASNKLRVRRSIPLAKKASSWIASKSIWSTIPPSSDLDLIRLGGRARPLPREFWREIISKNVSYLIPLLPAERKSKRAREKKERRVFEHQIDWSTYVLSFSFQYSRLHPPSPPKRDWGVINQTTGNLISRPWLRRIEARPFRSVRPVTCLSIDE